MDKVIQVGNILNLTDKSSVAGRVYLADGICPTLRTPTGGYSQPIVIVYGKGGQASEENHSGGIYIGVSKDFQHGPMLSLSRTLKANKIDAGVVERIAIASRGRNPENPSDRTAGSHTEQRLEPNTDGVSNCLTSVQKDSMVLEKEMYMSEEYGYRIRKLIPLETWRLQGFSDEDFHKAESVVSNSQLYRQSGNSIVENVLVAIFGQMISGKEDVYKNYNPYEKRIEE